MFCVNTCTETGYTLKKHARDGGERMAKHLQKLGTKTDLTLIDVNERAARFVETNVELNGLKLEKGSAAFYHGDLYQALPDGKTFDVITANPPYWPLENN